MTGRVLAYCSVVTALAIALSSSIWIAHRRGYRYEEMTQAHRAQCQAIRSAIELLPHEELARASSDDAKSMASAHFEWFTTPGVLDGCGVDLSSIGPLASQAEWEFIMNGTLTAEADVANRILELFPQP